MGLSVWVLILMANIDRGGVSVAIPMETEWACSVARLDWDQKTKTGRFYGEGARYAYCLNTKTGEMK
jgi:hypothetical protein